MPTTGRLAERWGWLVLAVPYAWLVARFWFLCDDAFISFRFGRNWAEGLGVVFNPGLPPVEGYSDFLWVAVGAAVQAVGLDPRWVMPAISAACGAVLVAWVHEALRRRLDVPEPLATASALGFAALPAIGVWATGGLETMPFCLALFATFDLLVLARCDAWRGAAVAGVALTLIRTEGIGWVLVLGGLAVLARRWDATPRSVRPVARWLGAVLAAYAVYYAWRYAVYHTLVANTAVAKVHPTPEHLWRGLLYVASFELVFFSPALFLLGAWPALRHHRGTGAAVALLAVAFPTYAVVVGGDYMPMGRLLVAGIAPAALLWGLAVQQLAGRVGVRAAVAAAVAVAAIGVLPAFDVNLTPLHVRESLKFRDSDVRFLSEHEKWAVMKDNAFRFELVGKALATLEQPGDSITAWAIGALGWHTHLTIYDLHGLVSAEVAWDPEAELDDASPGHDMKVGSEFFLDREPTFTRAKLLSGPQAVALLERYVVAWRFERVIEDPYVEDFRRVQVAGDDTLYLVMVVRRVGPGETPFSARQAFRKREAALIADLTAEGRPPGGLRGGVRAAP